MEKEVPVFEEIDQNKEQTSHTPSTIQADTLFTFTDALEHIITYITKKKISARYNIEDIEYLKISKINKIAFPMKCFCDINFHKLEIHLEWYGYYGLAFSKEWGMKKGIQPVQYINMNSELSKDFSKAFNAALETRENGSDPVKEKLQNYLLHELMYYKPYEGKMKTKMSRDIKTKCFTDECEWRFIPDVTPLGFQQVYFDAAILNSEFFLRKTNDAISNHDQVSLSFEYSELKYIIIKERADLKELICSISDLDREIQDELISKVIIWDESGRDF